MRMVLLLFCFSICLGGKAQRTIDVSKPEGSLPHGAFYSVGGTPFMNAKFVRLIDGTPYFREEWMKGTLTTPSGQEFKDLSIKLDLFDNEIHYIDSNGQEMIVTIPIQEVAVRDALMKTYTFVQFTDAETKKPEWLQRLATGKASLYKKFSKSLSENKPYGSATTEQEIKTTEIYLVHYNQAMLQIKKLKDAPAVLANKKAALEEWLRTERGFSMDDRFIALINYYNTLLEEPKK